MSNKQSMVENGIGAARIPRSEWRRDELQQRSRKMLNRVLTLKTTVGFLGAGLSVPYGYPVWGDFVKKSLELAKEVVQGRGTARFLASPRPSAIDAP